MKVKNNITFEELKTLQRFLKIDKTFQRNKTIDAFENAWKINWKLTLEMMFYLRDCRGGKGIRKQFHWLIIYMSQKYPDVLVDYLNKIPYYGCWKDLWELMETPLQQQVIDMYIAALVKDKERMENGLPVSYAAKWFPSENRAIDKEYDVVFHFSLSMNLAPSHIRKHFITPLRKYINVCETLMSENKWNFDLYDQNGANYKHRKCFKNKFGNKFKKWLDEKPKQTKLERIDIITFQRTDRYRLCFKDKTLVE